jgi:hypothetical protein
VPTISITIGGLGRTRTISAGDLSGRLLPAMRYMAAASPEIADPENDLKIVQGWADAIIRDLQVTVDTYEEVKRIKTPLVLT